MGHWKNRWIQTPQRILMDPCIKQAPVLSKRFWIIPWLLAYNRLELDCIRKIISFWYTFGWKWRVSVTIWNCRTCVRMTSMTSSVIPLHSLPSAPLPCPLPYPTISIRTGLGAETFLPYLYLNPSLLYPPLPSQHPPTLRYPSTSYLPTPLPSNPIHSAQLPCPNTLSYCTLPSPPISSLLSPPFIPSPSVPYAPIASGLPCTTQRFRKSQRPRCFGTRMYRGRNCLVQNVIWRTDMTALSLIGPGNV